MNMILNIVLACLTVAWRVDLGDCLECYSCTNVSHVALCKPVIQCTAGQVCHKSISAAGAYTLGCKARDACNIVYTGSGGSVPHVVGRDVQTKRFFKSTSPATSTACSECCEDNMCNRQLCQYNATGCQDSGHVDCQTTGTMLNLCSDTPHAVKQCRRFCGLCSMVDGGWTAWSAWSACSTSCGNGTESRLRQCSNPPPTDGGAQCTGPHHGSQVCSNPQCPVDGSWSTWTSWDACSVTCGVGLKHRTRTCSNPAPALSGLNCLGDVTNVDICLLQACQDGTWSMWVTWSSCSATCGVCTQTRHRSCIGQTVGKVCSGDNNDVKARYTSCGDMAPTHHVSCPTISTWSPWINENSPTPSTDEKEAITPAQKAAFCGTRASHLTAVHCQTVSGIQFDKTADLGTTCDIANGFSCSAVDNIPNGCQNYKIIYECQETICDIEFNVRHPIYAGDGERITFVNVTSNSSGGFNTSTGIFPCRVPGLYSFTLTLFKPILTTYLVCPIFKNDELLDVAFKGNISNLVYQTMPVTRTVVTHLHTGDEVYVNCSYSGTKPLDYTRSLGPFFTSFSGYLITKD